MTGPDETMRHLVARWEALLPPPVLPAADRPPDVPTGTELHLRPGEWADIYNLPVAGTTYLDVTVSRLGERIRVADGVAWVWVVGHALECRWASAELHPPCVELLVRLDALSQDAR